jgi:hypothetical protein
MRPHAPLRILHFTDPPCFQLGWCWRAVSWQITLAVEAQDLAWNTGTDQVDVMALAVKNADYSARALLGNLGPDGVVSDHGILLEDRWEGLRNGKSYHVEASYQEPCLENVAWRRRLAIGHEKMTIAAWLKSNQTTPCWRPCRRSWSWLSMHAMLLDRRS